MVGQRPAVGSLQRLRYAPPGRAVVGAGKAVLRGGAMLTAGWRPPFDLLVIGAKRGGTTSLWRYLLAHPGVLPLVPRAANVKGTYFLADEWRRGERWWRSHPPTVWTRRRIEQRLGHRTVVADASPYYLFHPLAPARAADLVPDAVALAVLRDPVERAWSHYKERCANRTEARSFADALAAEPFRLRGEHDRIVAEPGRRSFAHRHQSYLAQSRYAPMLRRWFDHFGRDRTVVLVSEELYADPQGTMDVVFDALGLPGFELPDLRAHNAEPSADLAPVLRARLTSELTPDVVAVESLLGRPLPWPRD